MRQHLLQLFVSSDSAFSIARSDVFDACDVVGDVRDICDVIGDFYVMGGCDVICGCDVIVEWEVGQGLGVVFFF